MLPDEIDFDEPDEEVRPVFKLIPATELTAQPASIRYLIDGYVPEQSLIEIFGPPGHGKSFVSMDMAFCIAGGIDWHGLETQQGPVVYIAGEGFSGIGQRVRALEIKHGIPAKNFYVSTQPASLTDEENAAWVAEAVRRYKPVLIVIDTLSRNFGGGDENSTRDMNAFVSNLDTHIKGNAAVLIVHHTGLVEKSRARGSSVLHGAMDAEYSITKDDRLITFANTKMKESEPPPSLMFEMTVQDLNWTNEAGDPIKSIVLEKTDWTPTKVADSKWHLSARDDAILTSLNEAIAAHGVEPTAAIKVKFAGFCSMTGEHQKVVHIDHWRGLAYQAITIDSANNDSSKSEAKKKAFKRCRDKLFNSGLTVEYGDYAWRIFP
jgi:archaellum biogenesis ATPase FlaH